MTTRQQDRYTSVTHVRDRNLTEAKQNDTLWDRMKGNCANQGEEGRIACEATLCRLSVVSQTQTTSLTRPRRHLRYTRADLGSSSLKKVKVQFADGTMSIAEWENVIKTHV